MPGHIPPGAWFRGAVFLLLLSGAAMVGGASPVCAPPAAAIVAWYAGDGNANDIKNGNNGIADGGLSYAAGEVGQAFSLDGTDADVHIAAAAGLDVGSSGSGLSVDAWIDPVNANAERPLVEWNNGAVPGVHLWTTASSATCPANSLYANIIDTGGGNHPLCSSANALVSGVFQHVALTYDRASGTAVLYRNGAAVGQANLGSFIPQTSYDLYLGDRPAGPAPITRYAGLLDEVRIADRALSAAEVLAIYQAGSAGLCKSQLCATAPPNLLAWYKGEGNANDTYGSNKGTAEGALSYAAGEVGQGFSTDGVASHVQIPDSPSLHPLSLTADAWINLRSIGSGYRTFFSKALGSGVCDSFVLWMDNGQFNASACTSGSSGQTIASGITLSPNTWYHVAMTVDDKTHLFSLYLNGQLLPGSSTLPASVGYDGNPMTIGADISESVPAEFVDGVIDEVQLYSRALTPQEIATIYRSGSNGTCLSGAVSCTPASLGFGNVAVGSSLLKNVGVSNTGSSPSSVSSSVSGTGFALSGSSCGAALAPGKSCIVSVTFTPGALGAASGTLSLSASPNDSQSPHLIALSGSGTAPTAVMPVSLAFGNVAVGSTSPTKSVILSNYQSAPISLGTSVSGTGFTIAGGTCGATLAAFRNCTVLVSFSPGALGAASGTLTLSGSPDSLSPHSIALSGTGSAATTLSPSSLAFGNVAVGSSSVAGSVTLTNNASNPINLSTPGLSTTSFALAGGSCGTTLAAFASCTVAVSFTPTALGAAPASTLTLGDSADATPYSVGLSGTGVTQVTVAPTSLAFGLVIVGNSVSKNISLSNNQGVPINLSASVSGAGFAISGGSCGATLAAFASCIQTVSFTPVTAGTFNGKLSWTDSPDSQSPHSISLSGASRLPTSLTASSLAFGNVAVGSTRTETVTLGNNTSGPISVGTGISGSGFAISGGTCGSSLARSSTCTVAVTFTPTAVGTAYSGNLTLSDSADAKAYGVALSGTGAAQVTLLPASSGVLSWGAVTLGSGSTKNISIANNQPVPLSYSAAINPVNGTSGIGYTFSRGTCATKLAAFSSCILTVNFTASQLGSSQAELVLSDSPDSQSPQYIVLTGLGKAPTAVTPGSVAFGNVAVGNTGNVTRVTPAGPSQITVLNYQSVPISINAALSGTGFAIAASGGNSPTCGATLGPAAANQGGYSGSYSYCYIPVTFTPNSLGAYSGSVTVTLAPDATTGGTSSPHTVSLSGTGSTPTSVAPSSLVFSKVAVGDASKQAQAVTLSNNTSSPINASASISGADFTILTADSDCNVPVPAFSSCTLYVESTPTVVGATSGSLTLSDSVDATPYSIALSGTGTAQTAVTPSTLAFGSVTVGSSSAVKTVKITNFETAAISVGSSVSGNGFVLGGGTCGATLAPSASCTVGVSFAPAAVGAVTGTLILSDSPDLQSPHSITLTGTGH